VGTQYRSVIFYWSDAQRETALQVIDELTEQKVFDDPIVTAVEPEHTFYPAEDYHQHYFRNHPNQGYCQVVVAPKVQKFRKKFAAKWKH
jgi:peptide-methionine (S)-S-oxide reductase